MKDRKIFKDTYLFIEIPNNIDNLVLYQYSNDNNEYMLSWSSPIIQSDDFVERLHSLSNNKLNISSKSKLLLISDLNNITIKQAELIIDYQIVDVDGKYYPNYINNEPITDGDWKHSLKTAIIDTIGDKFKNIAIIKIIV